MEELLLEAQEELDIFLAEKQKEAVRNAFSFLVSIITGGPGTGKTTIEKVILYIHEKLGGGSVLLMAPTGRASRRMAETCTGFVRKMVWRVPVLPGIWMKMGSGEKRGREWMIICMI